MFNARKYIKVYLKKNVYIYIYCNNKNCIDSALKCCFATCIISHSTRKLHYFCNTRGKKSSTFDCCDIVYVVKQYFWALMTQLVLFQYIY